MEYPLPRGNARLVPILLYHACTKSEFKEHLQWIKTSSYTPVHLGDIARYFDNPDTETFPEGKLVLTFDDAYQSFYSEIFPLLREHNVRATVCVPTGCVADTDEGRKIADWENGPQDPIMIWDELEHLVKSSLIEIIPHSASHISFDSIEHDEDRLRTELGDSKRATLAHLGLDVVEFFCFPYGACWSKETPEKVLAEMGYRGALRADDFEHSHGWNRYCIPRWSISESFTFEDMLKVVSDDS